MSAEQNNDKKRLIKLRKKKKFERQNSHKHGRVPTSWRRAKGRHSNVRLKRKYAKDSPNPGYGSPKKVRGLHPSGLTDNLVHRPADLEELEPEEDGVRIASDVGNRKKEVILEEAHEKGLHVFNAKTIEKDDSPEEEPEEK